MSEDDKVIGTDPRVQIDFTQLRGTAFVNIDHLIAWCFQEKADEVARALIRMKHNMVA